MRPGVGKTALCLITIATAFTPVAAAAQVLGYVTAESRYGNGFVRAPVRNGQFGRQVQLPGGTWIYCEHNSLLFGRNRPCSETLRRESIDFWETRQEEQSGR